MKSASTEGQKILDINDDITPMYEELKIIFQQKQNKLKREVRQITVRPPLLEEGTMIIESKSINNVQMKHKPRRRYENQSKTRLTNPPTIQENILIQKPSIAPTNTMTTPNSKVKSQPPERS